jgi:hypothetical protein
MSMNVISEQHGTEIIIVLVVKSKSRKGLDPEETPCGTLGLFNVCNFNFIPNGSLTENQNITGTYA